MDGKKYVWKDRKKDGWKERKKKIEMERIKERKKERKRKTLTSRVGAEKVGFNICQAKKVKRQNEI